MWLITGPFDAEVVGELGFQKTKLLKTGKSYPLGRKDRPLLVASKKVSHDHCEFIVGSCTVDDVANPSARPSLEFLNKKDKAMRLSRGGELFAANPSAIQELEDGDIITIITGVSITVHWMSVCCYFPSIRGKSSFPLQSCASIGVNVVITPDPQVTHHLISTYTANSLIAASLVSACQFVKPEWLHEVIRLGNLPVNNDLSDGVSLERVFALPPINKYRPSFSPTLPTSQKVFKVWEPNEERLNMFQGYRYLCVGEKGREIDGDLREVISRAGGQIETFDAHSGKVKWHKALARGQAKEGKKLVVVGDKKSLQTAVGQGGWDELMSEAKGFGLAFTSPESIVQAVLDVDTSMLGSINAMDADADESAPTSSPLPSFVPNTHLEEPSVPPESEQRPPPSRRLTRRATSRQASLEPDANAAKTSEPERAPEASRPRKALTRRVASGKPVLTGLDDPSSILDAAPNFSAGPIPAAPQQPVAGPVPPTPARSRLKRRVVGVAAIDAHSGLESQAPVFSLGIDDNPEEPPLKKFKALFEASHPDHAGSLDDTAIDDFQDGVGMSLSQTQSQTQAPRERRAMRSGAASASLGVVQEEEEETQPGTTQIRGKASQILKRKAVILDEDETEGIDDESAGPTGRGLTAAKRRAVENVNSVERVDGAAIITGIGGRGVSKPPSIVRDQKPTKPDTDAAFLKAIASTRPGKKTEDAFDREFNQLMITKPDLRREEEEKGWALLGEFGDETGVRGNFMTIMEMDVFKKDGEPGSRQRRAWEGNPEWQGKVNFKKFKKRGAVAARTNIVELVISEGDDYGMGPAYWKGGNVQSQSQDDTVITQKPTRVKVESQGRPASRPRTQPLIIDDSDDEPAVAPPKRQSKPPSRTGSTAPKRAPRTTKSQPLFLDSDDDLQIQEADDGPGFAKDDDDDETLHSNSGKSQETTRRRTRATAKPRKAVLNIVDDDSDDDAVFKGFAGKKRGR